MTKMLHGPLAEAIRDYVREAAEEGALYRLSAPRIAREIDRSRDWVYRRMEAMRENGELMRRWAGDHYLYEPTEDFS